MGDISFIIFVVIVTIVSLCVLAYFVPALILRAIRDFKIHNFLRRENDEKVEEEQ